MRALKWWMRILGIMYILLGIQNLPILVTQRLESQYQGIAANFDSIAIKALVDTWFLFGIEILVLGALLLFASKHPLQNKILIFLVLILELTRGIGHDLYIVGRGYASEAFYLGFSLLHLIIIVTGILFYRRAQKSHVVGQRE